MNYKIGQFILTDIYGIGEILSATQSDSFYTFNVDFDIGDRSVNINKDGSNASRFRLATNEEISTHLKYRVYKRGEDRYLTQTELSLLKAGDAVLHPRKGFGVVSKVMLENGKTFLGLSFEGQPSSSLERDKGKLIRFSLTHNISNEFWEPIDSAVKIKLTDDQIVAIEEQVKAKLPLQYADFLKHYPIELVFFNRQRMHDRLNDRYLPNSLHGIVDLFEQFEAFELDFLTPIGSDGLGNFYVLKEGSPAVYFVEHEGYSDKNDNPVALSSKNFDKYAEKIAADINAFVPRVIKEAIERSSTILNKN